MLLDDETFSKFHKVKGSIKKNNIGTAFLGGYAKKPYGEADQDRYEDDGTDRKKKEGRREGGKEGRLTRAISSKISVFVSDCSYCHIFYRE